MVDPSSSTARTTTERPSTAAWLLGASVLAFALVAAALEAGDATWDLPLFAILLALGIASELIAIEIQRPKLRISTGFTVIIVAAVFLGATPAVLIGVAAALADGIRYRIPRDDLLCNLVAYAVFPLLAGTLFHETVQATAMHTEDGAFYLLILGLYATALVVDIAIVGGYACYIDRTRFLSALREALLLVVPYEVLAAVVALAVSLVYVELGLIALAILAITLPALQYLVRSLVLAKRRGEELEASLARLSEVARRDLLTELPNARGANELLATELERARLAGSQVSALIVDLDRFRSVNEELGHEAGDEILRQIAAMLRDAVRRIDTVARTGASEFTVILPESGESDAHLVAEQLLARVRGFGAELTPLTASIGIATHPTHAATVEELLKHARRALEAAKKLGRDRAVVTSQEVSEVLAGTVSRRADPAAHLATMMSLAEALDLRDSGTAEHSSRVANYATMMARELGLNSYRAERVRLAGVLHDIGKVGVSDEILRKPGPLDEGEWEEMRKHPETAARILGSRELADVREWILASHERPDGHGYPRGISGAEIPLEAQVIAVADAFAAMQRDRVYRPQLGEAAARRELRVNSGTQFDPEVVEALLSALDREREASTRAQEPR